MAELPQETFDSEYVSRYVSQGGLPFLRVVTPAASAEICLHGGHVTSFTPADETEVIWISPDAIYSEEKAIRGGIPVCWPWFGDHPSDSSLPAHGYARTSPWEVAAVTHLDPDTAHIELHLPTDTKIELKETGLTLKLAITVSSSLSLNLTTTNLSEKPFPLTAALHTYLQVGVIDAVKTEGLDGTTYLDKLDGFREKPQEGPVIVNEAVDRVYENTGGDILVHDAELDRTLRVSKSGSSTTVVWNPWKEGAEKMKDMPDNGYETMLCIEAANAGQNVISLEPGDRHTLGTTISVE